VSWRHLFGLLETFEQCPADIFSVSCINFIGFLRYLICVVKIFDRFSKDILLVSWRYSIGVLEILDRCFGDIWWVSWRYLIRVL